MLASIANEFPPVAVQTSSEQMDTSHAYTTDNRNEPGPSQQGSISIENRNVMKKWNEADTLALIQKRISKKKEFSDECKEHNKIWAEISKNLGSIGVQATLKQARDKWNQLKGAYRKTKDENRKTGNERKTFRYKNIFDDFMGGKASVDPKFTLDSLTAPSGDITSDDTDDGDAQSPDGKTKKRMSGSRQQEMMERILGQQDQLLAQYKEA